MASEYSSFFRPLTLMEKWLAIERIWVILRLLISSSVIRHRFFLENSKGWVISCCSASITSEWTAACCLTNSSASWSESVASLLLDAILEKNEHICWGCRNSSTVKIRFPFSSLRHLISFETSSGLALTRVVSPCWNFSSKYLFCLELNLWRGLADSQPAHPSGRQGEPQCISEPVIASLWSGSLQPRDALRNWSSLCQLGRGSRPGGIRACRTWDAAPDVRASCRTWRIRPLGMETGVCQPGGYLLVSSFRRQNSPRVKCQYGMASALAVCVSPPQTLLSLPPQQSIQIGYCVVFLKAEGRTNKQTNK